MNRRLAGRQENEGKTGCRRFFRGKNLDWQEKGFAGIRGGRLGAAGEDQGDRAGVILMVRVVVYRLVKSRRKCRHQQKKEQRQ
ncbi:MAG: hypothetical protein PHV34_14165 [Verrucomicrobiae bacterium]|nr:hypothetical protein [Verrucomicrobiae bacterium]